MSLDDKESRIELLFLGTDTRRPYANVVLRRPLFAVAFRPIEHKTSLVGLNVSILMRS